jgi:surface antigen
VGPWGFYTRHCTDYVAWRFFERDVAFSADMSGPNGKAGHFGAPGTWAANAAAIGFKVDNAPKAGSIAQWAGGEQGSTSAGHVAYVDRVNPDGSVVISEFDWSVEHGYSQRGQPGTTSVRAPRYIHIQDQ